MTAVTVKHITSNVSNQTHSQGPANKQVGLSSQIKVTFSVLRHSCLRAC